MSNQTELISRLSEMLDCMMDYAAEAGASRLIGFVDAYRESNNVLTDAHKAIPGVEESKHYQELENGYSQDRI